jgi:hypothetical protein
VRRADKLTTFMCRLSWNVEASTSWKPQGLSGPVMGLLYFYLYLYLYPFIKVFYKLNDTDSSVNSHSVLGCYKSSRCGMRRWSTKKPMLFVNYISDPWSIIQNLRVDSLSLKYFRVKIIHCFITEVPHHGHINVLHVTARTNAKPNSVDCNAR